MKKLEKQLAEHTRYQKYSHVATEEIHPFTRFMEIAICILNLHQSKRG